MPYWIFMNSVSAYICLNIAFCLWIHCPVMQPASWFNFDLSACNKENLNFANWEKTRSNEYLLAKNIW